ncbi:MAG: hypothetical protein NTX22_00385 [Ignavibacteriales bacterium]|nr:hypothetical protein [Ignavibacteriales bacterium]
MNKFLPAIVCGFAAGVLNIVPFVKNFTCCLIIPAAAVFSLILYQRSTKNFDVLKAGKCVVFGLLTGVFAALFGSTFEIIIVFVTKTSDISSTLPEVEKMIKDLPASPIWNEVMNLLYKISDEIKQSGFSILYTISIFTSSLIVNSIFGMVGGLIGMQILNKRIKTKS